MRMRKAERGIRDDRLDEPSAVTGAAINAVHRGRSAFR